MHPSIQAADYEPLGKPVGNFMKKAEMPCKTEHFSVLIPFSDPPNLSNVTA